MSLPSRGELCPSIPPMQRDISSYNAEQYSVELPYQSATTLESSNRVQTVTSTVRTGKRPAPPEDIDDDDIEDGVHKKRSRGRPRLDTKDETAADRRRTQIRLAQRAYRHRKDTAISSLEQKVSELETANETMSKEFSKFYDIILAEGILDIVPHTAPRLKSIADTLLRLASTVGSRTGPASSESDEPTMPCPTVDLSSTLNSSSNFGSANHGSQTSVVPDNASSNYSTSQQQHQLSYEVIAQATPNNASFPFFAPMEPLQSQHHGFPGHLIPNASPYPRLASPASYAFQERNFSRRLQRTTCERGLKLAAMSNPPPERFAAVFGFCLLFESRESIVRRLATGLRRSQNESLDTWKIPITSLEGDQYAILENKYGNAGLDLTNQTLLPMGRSPDILGFPTLSQYGPNSQSSQDDKVEQRIRMICQNFEGEFFTSDEIELFLCRLGIDIPQHADYVEAEIDLNDLEGSGEASLNLTSASAQDQYTQGQYAQGQFGGSGMATSNPHGLSNPLGNMWPLNASTMGNYGGSLLGPGPLDHQTLSMGAMFGEASNPNHGLGAYMDAQDLCQMWPATTNWTKTKVTVDVRRLIEEMVSTSVCLGRTPGVRAKDVVRAVKIATGLITAGA